MTRRVFGGLLRWLSGPLPAALSSRDGGPGGEPGGWLPKAGRRAGPMAAAAAAIGPDRRAANRLLRTGASGPAGPAGAGAGETGAAPTAGETGAGYGSLRITSGYDRGIGRIVGVLAAVRPVRARSREPRTGAPAEIPASTCASSALDGRSAGRFSRQRPTSAATASGRPSTGGSGSGSVYWCARSSAVVVPTSHGSWPISVR